MIGFSMTEEQIELVELVRSLLREEIYPTVLKTDQKNDEIFDWSYIRVLARHNLIAPLIPKEYGGRGLDFVTTSLIIEEIAAVCAGLAACMVGTLHGLLPIILAGSEDQKRRFLPLFVEREASLASFALTEPKGGSDIERLETTAQLRDGCYYIQGIKDYVINGAVSNFVTVCANGGKNRRAACQFFVVPREQVKVNKNRKTLGIRYANTAQLHFQNACVSNNNLVGDIDGAYLLLNHTLDLGRPLIGAIEVGIARAAYELVLAYAQEREQFGRPIFSNQGVSFPLVRMATSIDAARLMVWRACSLIDQEGDYTKASSMAKLFASEAGQSVTARAIDIMGAFGYTEESLLNVYFRDAKVCSIVGGTDNVQQMIIASLL
ncbi:MAG: hypothetical protein JL50_13940 [Peptococcaceae bacterium BICA1-7]|nr:MAG: hypothetical protein JL50_13940 [Peptococcaceae bacterium BICA1-7]HBV96460.1 hypothetical protein [Desulfotomaculum sp.]